MATALPAAPNLTLSSRAPQNAVSAQAVSTPWYIRSVTLAVTSALVGGFWDISWHMTIGRDTFWTPAHMAIYFCGVLAGLSCSYLIVSTTLHPDSALYQASVTVWRFRGPLGAFLCAWGAVAMITSAPFDNWWHNAYGLDVKIFSPPHLVLDSGILAIDLGALIMILAAMNRAARGLREKLQRHFLYMGGMLLLLFTIVVAEYTSRFSQHSARCYRLLAIGAPLILLGVARASGQRWACTILAGIYMAGRCGQLWILPLFPAEPKLGPVYHQVTHFVPMEFPVLLIVPGIAVDLLRLRLSSWGKGRQAAVAGLLFVVTLVAAQYPFASFLVTPAARNWFFGAHYLPYFANPNFPYWFGFYPFETTRLAFWGGLVEAVGIAMASSHAGLIWGDWMRRVRR